MTVFQVDQSPPLRGETTIHPAKNAVLPVLAASLLTAEPLRIPHVPPLTDVHTLCELLEACGCIVQNEGNGLSLCTQEPHVPTNDEPMRRMRASVLIMGPLLARIGHARISLPGGCAIGQRPIDLHIKGMQALGAEVVQKPGYLELNGALRGGSVVGDHTVMFAGELERVEIAHKAQDRAAFAAGALRAMEWAANRAPGIYTMRDVLGFSS